MEQRKRREVDPTLQLLREPTDRSSGNGSDAYTRERLKSMTEFFEAANSAYGEMSQVTMPVLTARDRHARKDPEAAWRHKK